MNSISWLPALDDHDISDMNVLLNAPEFFNSVEYFWDSFVLLRSFTFIAENNSIAWLWNNSFTYLLVSGHLSHFPVLGHYK